MIKIAAIKEKAKGEYRVAITPETARSFCRKGYKVLVEKNIGLHSNFIDKDYEDAGAKVYTSVIDILSDTDILIKVQPTPLSGQNNELDLLKTGSSIIGMISPYLNPEYIKKALYRDISIISMEMVPRITKAQNMDVLSSQSNLSGYRAVIEASYYLDRSFAMMMTAAGTINPTKTLILGVGVAGLQAIATAKRLGSIVSAYDIRPDTQEQVESLGGKFIHPIEIKNNDAEDEHGYAKEVDKDFAIVQNKFLSEVVTKFDIIITTAQIPGKKAPVLLTKSMISSMMPGSVIIDMASNSGGNVEDSIPDKVVTKRGVKIIGWSNMASRIASDSSKLYAKNLLNFLLHAVQDNKINFEDSIVEKMLLRK